MLRQVPDVRRLLVVQPVPHLSPERLEHLRRLIDASRLRAALYPAPQPPPVRRRSRSRQYLGGRSSRWRTGRGRHQG
ncbi:hypothetical protein ACFY84_25590 [Streptomyces sp. NPDC012438]|uniref:hypothetical protein n=1 Tax=Streptomyces sp. NPDC012438 TaxID=3364833 RepID=UPI0036E2CC0F